MESPRDPLPAYLSAEPDPADPRPPCPGRETPASRRSPCAWTSRRNRCAWVSPRNRYRSATPTLIAACGAGDAAAYDTLYRRHVTGVPASGFPALVVLVVRSFPREAGAALAVGDVTH
jgi:hypothetical protein